MGLRKSTKSYTLEELVEDLRVRKEALDLFHDKLSGKNAVFASTAVTALETAIYNLEELEARYYGQ